jgi:hypothetical protein
MRAVPSTGRIPAPGSGTGPGRLEVVRALAVRLVAIAAVAAAAAGCSRGPAKVALPGTPAPVQTAGVTSEHPSERRQVLAAYQGYWQATNHALDSRNAARARLILAAYLPGSALPGMVRGMRALWVRDEISYGSPELHIMSVRVTSGQTADVHDCVDMSHAGLQDWRTGQIIGGLGQSHENLITTLALEHGRWLVTGSVPVVRSCSY